MVFIKLVNSKFTVFIILDGVVIEWGHVFYERCGIEIDISGIECKLIIYKNVSCRWMSKVQTLYWMIEE